MDKKKKKLLLIIAVLLLALTLGYAFLNANLKINGISNIGNVKWEVYFENSALTEENTLAGAVAPVIEQGTKPTEIGYNVTFNTPGEVYEFTVDVKNGGTIDATVSSITSSLKVGNQDEVEIAADKSNLPDYLDYDLTDEDGNAIELPFDLAKTQHKTLKLRLTFKQDITAEQLAQAVEDSTIRFNMMMRSRQKGAPAPSPSGEPTTTCTADSTSDTDCIYENLDGTYYLMNWHDESYVYLNQPVPATVTLYNSPEAAMKAWENTNIGVEKPSFVKIVVENNIVTEGYVGFKITQEMKDNEPNHNLTVGIYYIRGGYGYYEDNIDVMIAAFGEDNNYCNLSHPGDYFGSIDRFTCWTDDSELAVDIFQYGGESNNYYGCGCYDECHCADYG